MPTLQGFWEDEGSQEKLSGISSWHRTQHIVGEQGSPPHPLLDGHVWSPKGWDMKERKAEKAAGRTVKRALGRAPALLCLEQVTFPFWASVSICEVRQLD